MAFPPRSAAIVEENHKLASWPSHGEAPRRKVALMLVACNAVRQDGNQLEDIHCPKPVSAMLLQMIALLICIDMIGSSRRKALAADPIEEHSWNTTWVILRAMLTD